ncbi:hypothetical protein GOODEAATRI_014763 [Goodea atripinnis]|uniref:C2H2-type domain-containing protein n=1 Tax=Goodea atripinnis TaxID=208336 RepID=A0ABV0NAQ5_9TELE
MSKSDILRGIITEKLSTAAREILAVVERTVTDYEKEASGFRQQIDRQRRQLELLQPQVKLHRGGQPNCLFVQVWRILGVWTFLGTTITTKSFHLWSFSSRVQPEKRRPSKPLISDDQNHLDFRVRILDDPQTEVLSNIGESDFLDLLRSTFPQLAAGAPFDLFMTDNSRRLHPLMVNTLTPEEIYTCIRSSGNSALYIRMKDLHKPSLLSFRLLSPIDQPQKRRRGRPRLGEEPTHYFLRICVLEGRQADAPSESELQTSSVKELRCPRGLQEAAFLDLLRITFPQLVGDDKKINIFKSDRSRKLQRLKVSTMTPEEIYRSMKSTGIKKSLLYIKLKVIMSHNGGWGQSLSFKAHPGVVFTNHGRMEQMSPEDLDQSKGSMHSDEEAAESDTSFRDGNEDLEKDDEWKPNPEETEDDDLEHPEGPQPKRALKGRPRRVVEKGEESKAPCQVCGVRYRTLSGFAKHAWSHADDPKSVCGVCGETFNSSEDLKGHLPVHHKTYDCSYCGKAFFTTAGLKNHISLHTGEREFKCNVCSKSFTYKSALDIHRWVHVEDRPHKCDMCPKSFGLKGQLVAHKKCHTSRDRYLCNICGRSVFDLRSLTRHKLTHSTERRFGCKVCGKRFKLEGTLKAHEKVHTVRDRMYLCHICCKTFLSNNTLMAHMKTHSGERPFVCSICSRSFLNKWDLKKHMRVHTGEAPYGCFKCGRHFKLKSTLNVHIRSHLGIKRFSCGVCGKACSRQEHLTVHMRTHNGERPYKCSLCDKDFTQSHCLKTHMKSCHPEEIRFPEPSTSEVQPPGTE